MNKIISPELCDFHTCTGCGACANSCPTDALQLRPDGGEGFYRPVIDPFRCINCLKCERTCPVLNPVLSFEESDLVFAAWHRDPEIRRLSSSGGAFSALAQSVLDEGGSVIGAAYTEDLHLKHMIVESSEGLIRLRASKYFQSEIGLVFREAEQRLKAGRQVLFCGTPCQVAGFRAFLGEKTYGNLVLVDFICHGVPSPSFFQKYIQWLSDKYGNITDYRFRDKKKGWKDSLRVIMTTNKLHTLKGKDDCFWVAFNNNNNNLQESCYDCRFLGTRRNSDITISDFWRVGRQIPFGHKKEIPKGVSMVMVNTPVGTALFKRSVKYLAYYRRSLVEVVQGNPAMMHSSSRPVSRTNFYLELNELDFDMFLRKYLIPNRKTRMAKAVREYMPAYIVKLLRSFGQK